jgi:hypothetical protein
METQTYYFKPNYTYGQVNYSNDGCYFYKIVIDEKNINIYEAPPQGSSSWGNAAPLPSDDKFTKKIITKNMLAEISSAEIDYDSLSDEVQIIPYYREHIHKRISKFDYITLSPIGTGYCGYISFKDWSYVIEFLIDMKALNKREIIFRNIIDESVDDYKEMINEMIENNKEHNKNYKDIISKLQDEKNELEEKHSEMKNYFQNKIKNLNELNEELQKFNSLLKREIKIVRLSNTSNEIKFLEKFQNEAFDKENYLENELKNDHVDKTDKIELHDKVKFLDDLYNELDDKIRVLNVNLDPTKSAFRGELSGSDCYICDNYCHDYCSCVCHSEENIILNLSEK